MKQEMLGLTSQRETFRINCVVSVGSTKLNILGYQLSMQPSCNVVQYKFQSDYTSLTSFVQYMYT